MGRIPSETSMSIAHEFDAELHDQTAVALSVLPLFQPQQRVRHPCLR